MMYKSYFSKANDLMYYNAISTVMIQYNFKTEENTGFDLKQTYKNIRFTLEKI